MALALLFSLLRSRDPNFVLGDNPCGGAYAFVIDHKLRENSTSESHAVVAELNKLDHIWPRRLELDWSGVDPHTVTGMETAARRLRYRTLGAACASLGVTNLLMGHHADDLHETVLMRMLAGHPARGLGGMRRFNDIPECYDMHGVYQSGFIDMMRRKNPPLSYKPARRDSRKLRRSLLADMRDSVHEWGDDTLEQLTLKKYNRDPDEEDGDMAELFVGIGESEQWHPKSRVNLPQLETEDGGVRICRPFLGFEKERLVATCEAAGVQWFEDPTNNDPKLTSRNAVRHMLRTSKLPAALQRPAILRLAERVRERVASEEDEAGELLQEKTGILDLRTNTGTMVVELPDLLPGDDRERSRTIASLLVRRLIGVVTPEIQTPTLPSLQGTVSRLFPRLSTPAHPASAPSSFNVASVLFTRLPSAPATPEKPRWHLSRAPYPSTEPAPSLSYYQPKGYPQHGILSHPKPHWTFIAQPWRLFDGRFWVKLNLRLAGTVTVAPFRPEFSKAFKKALPKEERERLEGSLAYAPGKARYTLPAVYYDGEMDLEKMETRVTGPRTMLALPTLGVGLPGLEKVLEYQVRYRKIDEGVLEKCGMESMPGCEIIQ